MKINRLITLLVVLFISTLALAQKTNSLKPVDIYKLPDFGKSFDNILPNERIFGLCDYITINQDVVFNLNAKIKWRNTIPCFPERFSSAGLQGTMSKIQTNTWLAFAPARDGDFPNPRSVKPTFNQFSGTGYKYLPLELPQSQKIIFNQKTKVWKPRGVDIIIGAVFTGLGAAAMWIPPFPDFKSEKVGPQVLFIVGGSTYLVGLGTMISGILHRAKVNQQPYDPAVASGQMTLLSSVENNKALSNIVGILEQGNIKIRDKANNVQGIPKQVSTFDDRIEIMTGNQKSVLSFKDLYICGLTTIDGFSNVFDAGYVEFKLVSSKEYKQLVDLENNLNFIRNQFERQAKTAVYNDRLNVFKPLAAKYRSLVSQPTMSENQRKLIVQANVFTEKMQYDQAVNMLNEALAIDPIAYPTGYTNLALLFAHLKRYDDAILNMKKYLLLEPDAPDARDSQDKIYEWELLLKK